MKFTFLFTLILLTITTFCQEICDDLITYDDWEYDTYESIDWNFGDTLGYFADGSLPITAAMDYSDVPTGVLFMDGLYPGLYGYNMGVQFNFLGNEQTVTMQIYVEPGVTYDQYGVYVNESDSILLDADFPIVVEGITIDMEDLGILDDTYILLELSFTGLIDSIIYQPSSSGIIEVCSTLPSALTRDLYLQEQTLVYPNPVANQLNIKGGIGVSHLTLYTLMGEVVLNQDFQATKDQIILEIGHLPSAIYLLRVQFDDGTILERKIIRR